MRCLYCLKNNIPKLYYCSGCGRELPKLETINSVRKKYGLKEIKTLVKNVFKSNHL